MRAGARAGAAIVAAVVATAVPRPARADDTGAIVAWSLVGGLDASLIAYDAVTLVLRKSPGLPLPIVEIALAAPQLVLAPILIAASQQLGPACSYLCDAGSEAVLLTAGIGIGAAALGILAHGIFGVLTKGWGTEPPHAHAVVGPVLVGRGAGVGAIGFF